MTTLTKPTRSEVDSDLRGLIDLRRQAEQRGHFEPLGRLLYLKTAHGNILWPVEDGECIGPDVATVRGFDLNATTEDPLGTNRGDDCFILLGPWLPLPPVRAQSSKPCPKCLHVCDICGGEKIKQCEMVSCGGKGTVSGGPIPCPGKDCSAATGRINPAGCEVCHNAGHIPEQRPCPMCKNTGKMVCPRCRGRGKISTGKVRGSVDWKADDCAACHGSGWKGAWKPQNVEKFINAKLDPMRMRDGKKFPPLPMWALGPIYEFGIEDPSSHQTRIFDVGTDSVGDYLMLLIPAGHKRQAIPKAKAYLVGGVVRERVVQGVA
jgi:hypothetical protein